MATVYDKEAWLEERRKGLGGSDIAKICGLSKWGNALDVYLDKKGLAKPVEETLRMRLGTFLEPFVTDEFMKATGKRCIEYTATIHGEGDRSCCLGNLDRIVVEPNQDINDMVERLSKGDLTCIESILECKTTGNLSSWYDEEGNVKVPEWYITQVDWYMGLIPSCKRVYVAVVGTGLDCAFEYICIERREKTIDGLMSYCVKWWKDNIESSDETAVMERLASEASSVKEVASIYPHSNPESEFVVTDDVRAKLNEYKALKAEIEAFESEVDENGKTREDRLSDLETDITKEMKDKEFLVDSDDNHTVLATFKSGAETKKDICDWKAVAEALAEKLGDAGVTALDELVRANTQFGVVTRKGSRPFKVKSPKKPSTKKSVKKAA